MRKKILLILFFVISLNCFSDINKTNIFNLYFTLKYNITNKNLTRGATLNWSSPITKKIYWGIGSRIIHNDYSSLWTSAGTSFKLIPNVYVPLDIGVGVKLKDLDFSLHSQEGLTPFLHGQTGIEWILDENWRYILHTTYNYNILSENNHNILLNFGIMYIF